MARNIVVRVRPDADLSGASDALRDEARRMQQVAERTADEIESEFNGLMATLDIDQASIRRAEDRFQEFQRRIADTDVDIQVDDDQLRQAFDLAERLDRQVASIDVDTDLAELNEINRLASSLNSFTGRLGLDVEGRADLRETLGLAENLDRLREVRVEVRGRQDLERATRLADELERPRTVPIDARADDLIRLDGQFDEIGAQAGQQAAAGFGSALGNIDTSSIGATLLATAGTLGPIVAGLGLLFGDDLAAGIDEGFSANRNLVLAGLRTGLDEATLQAIGAEAGAAYSAGFGDSLTDVRRTAQLLEIELGGLDPTLDLDQATAEAEAFAEVFGVDVPRQIRLTQRLIASDLVDDNDEAMSLLVEAAQRYPLAFEDIFDVTDEFSTNISRLGVDGSQALFIIGEAARSGLFPNIDRAGEQFEEFTTRIIDGDAAEAIEQLDLSVLDLQNRIASGDGAAALVEVSEALLAVESDAQRATLANQIFGASFEQISDVNAGLELLATADQIRDVGDASGELVADLEASRTGFQRLSRGVQDLGTVIGTGLNTEIEILFDLLDGDPLGALEGVAQGAEDAFIGLRDVAGLGPEITVLEEAVDEAGRAAAGFGEEAEDAASGVSELRDEVFDLDAALDDFAGRFDTDSVFRSIDDDIRSLTEAFVETEDAAFSAAQGFDTTTEAGSRAEAAAERLSGNLDELIEQYRESPEFAAEFVAGQQEIEDALADIGARAGLTGEDLDAFIEKYSSVPPDIEREIRITDNASSVIESVRRRLAQLADRNITLSANSFVSPSGQIRRAATGDVADSPRIRLIGEYPGAGSDPELVSPRSQMADVFREVLAEARQSGGGDRVVNQTIMVDPNRAFARQLIDGVETAELLLATG